MNSKSIRIFLLFVGLFLSSLSRGQTTLAAGDMAVIGCNRLVPFELAIVSLVDISSGTTIYITDYPYSNSLPGFTNTSSTLEGAITWTTTSAITKGSVFLIKFATSSGTPMISGLPGTISVTGWTNTTTSCPVAAGGDNWFIYQGSGILSPSTFVFGWTNYFATTTGSANGWVANGAQVATNVNTSELPPGLTNGSNAVSLAWSTGAGGSHGDNNAYKDIQSGTKSALLAEICDYTNWDHDEATTYQLTSASAGTALNSGNTYFDGSNPVFTVGTPCTLSASITSQTNVACNGGATGSLTVTRTGGTANYTYSWTNGSTTSNTSSSTNTINSLTAGSYTVTVTDANSCTATASATITEPAAALSATITSLTNVACNGASTGSLTVTRTGGTANYNYSWTNGSTTSNTPSSTNTINSLAAGSYTVTVTDANSCSATASATITQPAALGATITSQTNIACNGASTGALTVTRTGGTANYNYSWTNGSTTTNTSSSTNTISSLAAGSYTVTVTDANSCSATASATITQPTAMSVTIASQSDISCNGASDGAASINLPTGGAGSYTYNWTPGNPPGDGSRSVTGLSAQTYTCTVTDANSCTAAATAIINEPSVLSVSVSLDSSVTCFGGSNGKITATVSGGTSGGNTYTLSENNLSGTWNNTDAVSSVTGWVKIHAYNAGGTGNTWSATYEMPFAFKLFGNSVSHFCVSKNFLLTFDTTVANTAVSALLEDNSSLPSANLPDKTIAYFWDRFANGTGSLGTNDDVYVKVFGTAPNRELWIKNYSYEIEGSSYCYRMLMLEESTNKIYMLDGYNAAAAGSRTIGVQLNGSTAIQSSNSPNDVAAETTTIISNFDWWGFSPGGASGVYNYVWSNGASTTGSSDATNSISGLAAGTYTVTVTNANSCTATDSVTVTQPGAAMTASITSQTNVACNGGSTGALTATRTGGTANFKYVWTSGDSTTNTSDATNTASSLAAGSYTVTITDANACTATASATITEPAALTASITSQTNVACNGASTGALTVTRAGGTGNFKYVWTSGDSTVNTAAGTNTVSSLAAGSYTVTVTDANLCTTTASATITEPTALSGSITSQTDVACAADSTGSLTVTPSGGTGTILYSWAPYGGSAATASNLSAGSYTVTLTDDNSCTTTVTATVDASDNTDPVAVGQNITVYLDATGNVSITGTQINNGSSDNCSITSLTATPNIFTCANTGANSVILTASDGPNSDTAMVTVTVMDTVRPVATAQNITVYLDATGNASIVASDINSGSADACGISSLALNKTTFDCTNTGANTVWLTVTDVNGNKDSVSATVTVADTIKPTVITQNITTYLDASGSASITASDVNNGSTDACGISTRTLNKTSFTCANIGANTVWLTVTDVNGNKDSASATVTVQDTVKPVAVTQNITVYLNASGTTSIAASQVNNGSSDSCGIASMSVSPNIFSCANIGANTVTLTVTDNNSNSNTATATVTVMDTIKPIIAVQNITTYLDATGNASITASEVNNGSSDACGISTRTLNKTSFSCADTGANTVWLTVTDVNGNKDSVSATVTVTDTIKPTAVARNITVYLDATGSASITASQVNNGSSDICGIDSISISQNSFTCANTGANNVILTVTDVNGNSSTASSTVTVLDTVRPVATAQNITAYLDASGTVSITGSQVNNGSSDACGISSLALNKTTFDCTNIGANTVWLMATDANGNKDSVSATVTVADTIKPTVTTQNITTYLNASGNASITASQINNGSSDACGIASQSLSKTDFTCANTGSNTVWLTVTDVNGNKDSASATVTVQDTVKPVAVTQNITVYLNASGTTSITASQVNNGSSDSCGIASMSVSPNIFSCANVGANTVTLTVTDNNSNSRTATATVTVMDTVKPMVAVQNITTYLDATGNASITASDVNNGSSDACGISTRTLNKTSFSCADTGANTVWLTVTDVNGNKDSVSATVTVMDTVKPAVITQNITAYLNASGTASITASHVNNGSTDACGISALALNKTTFNCANIGSNTVWLTVTDVNGNKDSASATVTVQDTVKPTAVTQNITVYLNASGNASIIASQVNNGSSDSCGIASMGVSPNAFTCANVGANTVTLTVTDNNSNSRTATATVTVMDTVKPVATTQNITTYLDATGNASITASQVNNGSTDACGISTLALSKTSFTCANTGSNTVWLTVTDVNGNKDSASATVTVQDTVKPVAVTQNITVYLNASGNASITASQVNNGSSDSCGIASMSVSPNTFSCANVGSNTVTLTVTDNNSNSRTATATVTVVDTVKPVATAQNITTYLDATGNASITASQVNNGSADACGISTLALSKTSFACSDEGANTVWLTVTDVNGNKDSVSATVTVTDTVKPAVIAQNRTIYLDASGNVSILASAVNNGSSDACGISTTTLSKTSFSCADTGTNTIWLRVTDVNNNVDSASAVITVLDTVAPVIMCKTDTAILDINGNVTITAADVTGSATDNCGIASYALSKYAFTASDAGSNNVTLTVTDISGNVSTCVANVLVVEPKPVAICKNATIYLDASGNATLSVSDVNNGSYSLVGLVDSTISRSGFTCADLGTNTVTLVVTNSFNNQDSCTATVTVLDTIKPTVLTKNFTTYLNASGNASITVSDINNGTTDNCSGFNMVASKTSFTCNNAGANTVWLTVTDTSGNVDSASAVVMVSDTIKPTVNLQANVVLYLNAAGTVSITPATLNNGSFDNCGVDSLFLSKSTLTCADIGVKPITLIVKDKNGNIDSGSVNVVVLDPIAPVALPKHKVVVYLSNNGQAVINPSVIDSASTDNCTITSRVLSQTVFTCAQIGDNTITFTVQDQSGNSSYANAIVEVRDTIKPNVIVSNQTLYLNNAGTATVTAAQLNNNSTDNCGIDSTWASKTSFDCTNLGNNTVSLFARDVNGNINSANVLVNVFDTIRPMIRARQNLTLYVNAAGTATLTTAMADSSSSDNCTANVPLTLSKTTFNCTNLGSNSVTMSGVDGSGNTNSTTFNITVLDTIKPALTATNATLYLNAAGQASVTAAALTGSSSDNCSAPALTLNKYDFTCADRGSNTVTVTATDASGNSVTANASVTVLDTIRPNVIAQNLSVYLNASGSASITATQANNGSTDNCGITTYTLSKTSFTGADLGANLVTLTGADASGNSSSIGFTVTVLDTSKPVAITQNITAYLSATGTAVITAAQVNNGSTDNAGVSTISLSKTNFTCIDLGANLVTLSVTDASNNTGTATATVTILDTIKPVIGSQSITVYLNGIGSATITPAQLNNGSSDNCSITALTASKTSFTCSDRGANVVTLTATDAANNTASGNVTVTVLDTLKPNVVVNNNLNIYLNASGTATLTTAQVDNSSTDNCGIDSFSLGKTTFSMVDLGLNIISFTATDASGNAKTVNINVTVLDTIKPLAKAKDKTIYLDQNGFATIVAADINDGSTDNAGISSYVLSKTSFACGDLGTANVQLAVTDGSGNTSYATAAITVLDTIKPVLTSAPGNLTFGLCGASVMFTIPAATDNCSVAKVEQLAGIPAGGTYPVGVTTNTFRISDASGNSITTSFTVTIYPSYLPVTFTNLEMCSNAIPVDLSQGKDSLVFSGNGVLTNRTTFDPSVSGAGNHAITYIFTDSTGCSVNGIFFVTVNAAPIKPVIDRVTSATLKVRDIYDNYQWYRDNELLEGETGQTLLIKRTGVYTVSVSSKKGCTSVSDPIGIGVPVGISEVKERITFNVFPNPSNGVFVIEKNSTVRGTATVVITDIVGKEILRTTSINDLIEMDLTTIAAGTYYIRLEQGDAVSIKPIVIKN